MSASTIVPSGDDVVACRFRCRSARVPGRSGAVPRPVPAKSHRAVAPTDDEGLCQLAASLAAVLDADQTRLRQADLAPLPRAHKRAAAQLYPPEEVVRREEHEVAAEVAVTPGSGRTVRGHVLVVPGEDDEVVRAGQGDPPVRKRREVFWSERYSTSCPVHAPASGGSRRRRAHGRRAGRPPGSGTAGGGRFGGRPGPASGPRVPGVAPPVPVGVVEVVGLPGVRGRPPRPEPPFPSVVGRIDERRVADPPVVRGQLDEVDARSATGRARSSASPGGGAPSTRSSPAGRPGRRSSACRCACACPRRRRGTVCSVSDGRVGLDRQPGGARRRRSSPP